MNNFEIYERLKKSHLLDKRVKMGTLWRDAHIPGRVFSLIDYYISYDITEPRIRYLALYADTRIPVTRFSESVSVRYFIGLLNSQRIVQVL